MSEPELKKGDGLLIVDMQVDFLPGGLLPLEDGLEIMPLINRWIAAAQEADVPVFASRDYHPSAHCSFEEHGGPWPVHCVRGTEGGEIHPDVNLPSDAIVVDKGGDPEKEAYSAFDGTDLGDRMRSAGVNRVWVCGVALDYCVRASVLDGLKEPGLEIHLILDGTRGANVQPGDGERAVAEMQAAGAKVLSAI